MSYVSAVMAHHPHGFWKLDEASGTIAHDSSGNGRDMTPGAAGGTWPPPVWGHPAGPTGLPSAYWPIDTVDGLTPTYREALSTTAFSTNFTAGLWFKADSNRGLDRLMGQTSATFNGWGIEYLPGSDMVHATVRGGSFSLQDDLFGTVTPAPLGTWQFVSLVNDAGTWKLYLNGILQDTSTLAIVPAASVYLGVSAGATWPSSGFSQDVSMSGAFIIPGVLSADDLLTIYAGVSPAAGVYAITDGL